MLKGLIIQAPGFDFATPSAKEAGRMFLVFGFGEVL
jgi:hypothetical protein